jgi:hypothetical protein
MNPGIEQFLRAYAGMYQKDWVQWLPMAEFSYNNAVHSATGTSPFRCLYGRDPVMTPSKVITEVPEANNMADTLQQIWDETSAALRLAKERIRDRGKSLVRQSKPTTKDELPQVNRSKTRTV